MEEDVPEEAPPLGPMPPEADAQHPEEPAHPRGPAQRRVRAMRPDDNVRVRPTSRAYTDQAFLGSKASTLLAGKGHATCFLKRAQRCE